MQIPDNINDWAKTGRNGMPGISVRQHLMAVACVAEVLIHRFPHICKYCNLDINALIFLASIHDIGKLSIDFLQKSKIWIEQNGLEREVLKNAWHTYNRIHQVVSCESLYKFLTDNDILDSLFPHEIQMILDK